MVHGHYYYGATPSLSSTVESSYIGNLSTANVSKLVKMSKSAVRAAFGAKPWHSASPLLAKLNVLPLDTRYYLKMMVFAFRCIHSFASPMLSQIFTLRSCTVSARQTRGTESNALVLPNVSHAAGMHALSFYIADRWNMLPAAARLSTCPMHFRSLVAESLGYPVIGPMACLAPK